MAIQTLKKIFTYPSGLKLYSKTYADLVTRPSMSGLAGTTTSDNKIYKLRARAIRWRVCSAPEDGDSASPRHGRQESLTPDQRDRRSPSSEATFGKSIVHQAVAFECRLYLLRDAP